MKQRMNFYEKGFKAMKPLFSMGAYLAKSSVEQSYPPRSECPS